MDSKKNTRDDSKIELLRSENEKVNQLLLKTLKKDKEKLAMRVKKTGKNVSFYKSQIKKIKSSIFYKFWNYGSSVLKTAFEQYPLLLILIPFIAYFLPLCFLNNDYQNMVTAAHIDSGSILGSIIDIMNRHYFYDQTRGFHTSYYGFTFNSLVFWWFVFVKFILRLSPTYHFSVYAASARLINFFFVICSLIATYLFSMKLLKKQSLAFLVTLGLAIYPGFSFYAPFIKPDIMGLFMSIICFYLLGMYLESGSKYFYVSAAVLAMLDVFTKQTYVFLGIPLFIGFFIADANRNTSWYSRIIKFIVYAIQITLISLPIMFAINPFAFLKFHSFLSRQVELMGMTSASMSDNIQFWLAVYKGYPIIMTGIIIAFFNMILYLLSGGRQPRKIIFLISVYAFFSAIWLAMKVGPIRVEAYLIPFFGFLLISAGGFIRILGQKYKSTGKSASSYWIFFIPISCLLAIIYFYSAYFMLGKSLKLADDTFKFSKSLEVTSIKDFMKSPPEKYRFKEIKIVFTASIPVPYDQFAYAGNDWQFGVGNDIVAKNLIAFKPDIIMIDYQQIYEQTPGYWEKVALNIGLKKSKYYFPNGQDQFNGKNAIVVYYW